MIIIIIIIMFIRTLSTYSVAMKVSIDYNNDNEWAKRAQQNKGKEKCKSVNLSMILNQIKANKFVATKFIMSEIW
jgi:hypothetical protein